jgi:hypothetical protein
VTPTASYGSVANSNAASSNNNFVFPSVPLAFHPDIHPLEEKTEDEITVKKNFCCSFKNVRATGTF